AAPQNQVASPSTIGLDAMNHKSPFDNEFSAAWERLISYVSQSESLNSIAPSLQAAYNASRHRVSDSTQVDPRETAAAAYRSTAHAALFDSLILVLRNIKGHSFANPGEVEQFQKLAINLFCSAFGATKGAIRSVAAEIVKSDRETSQYVFRNGYEIEFSLPAMNRIYSIDPDGITSEFMASELIPAIDRHLASCRAGTVDGFNKSVQIRLHGLARSFTVVVLGSNETPKVVVLN
ncbi:MAG: hypothetical protein ACK50J_22345, partial [Planctomyces sp.]